MEKIAEIIEKNIVAYISAGFGLIAPGTLTITVFKIVYILELDILKLLLLSFCISAPVFGIIFIINLLADKKGDINTNGNAIFTISAVVCLAVFSVAIVLKILIRSITIPIYIMILLVLCSLYACVYKDELIEATKN